MRIWSNITYYANWYNPTQYIIRFSDYYSSDTYLFAHEGDLLLPILQSIAPAGYMFDYYLNGNLVNETTTMPDCDLSINPQNLRAKQFNVILDADGGTFSMEKDTFTYTQSYTIPSATPKKENLIFVGWQYNENIYTAGQQIDDLPPNDIILKAVFKEPIEYIRNDIGYTVLSCNDKSIKYLTIPSQYKGLPVTEIASSAFANCTYLKDIHVPDSVTDIKNLAFSNCTSLETVYISKNLINMGILVFKNCNKIKDITLPFTGVLKDKPTFKNFDINNMDEDSVKNMLSSMVGFIFDFDIQSILPSIPESLKRITLTEETILSPAAFTGCRLEELILPQSLNRIEAYAFGGVIIDSLTIPQSVTHISDLAFIGSSITTNISIEEGNDLYYSQNNCLIDISTKQILRGCNNSIIPTDGSVTSIGAGAFYGCFSLTNITIPNQINEIREYAFGECENLYSITISDNVKELKSATFYGCTKLASITLPKNLERIEELCFERCSNLKSITLPASLKYLGTQFEECSFTSITFEGTIMQWLQIEIIDTSFNYTVHCSDGDYTP